MRLERIKVATATIRFNPITLIYYGFFVGIGFGLSVIFFKWLGIV